MEGSEKKKSRFWKHLPSTLKEVLPKLNPTATVHTTQTIQSSDSNTDQYAAVTGGEDAVKKDVTEKFVALNAKEIWQAAFDQLRASESTKDLVVEYEEFLRPHFSGVALGKDANNIAMTLGNLKKEDQEVIMERLAKSRLAEIEKSGTSRRVMSTVSTIMDKIKGTVGNALSDCLPAAAGWSLACLIIIPITQNAGQIDANQSGLRYIISKLPWYTHLVELLNEEAWSTASTETDPKARIQERIIELDKCLIDYQLRTFHARNHKLESIVTNTISLNDWSGKIEEIKRVEAELMEYIDMINQVDVRIKFHDLLKNTEELKNDISALLMDEIEVLRDMGDNVQDIRDITQNKAKRETWERFKLEKTELDIRRYQEYVDGLEKLQPGTGLGVLEHRTYLEWREGDRGLLILAARPGTGKSVLAKHIRDQIRAVGGQTVCSFFFKDTNFGQNDPSTALCHIFYDILRDLSKLTQSDLLTDDIDHLEKEEIRPDCELMWSIIGHVGQYRPMTIVFDALDESTELKRASLLARLGRFESDFKDAKVKFLLTTRPLKDMPDEFDRVMLNMDVDPGCRNAIEEEILQVAEQKLEKLSKSKGINGATREELFEILKGHKDSTYLFIKLFFEYAQSVGGLYQNWVKIFNGLPNEVSEVYKRFLEGVDQDNQSLVKAMIQIVLAATRPLTVTEMKIAVKLHFGNQSDCEKKEDYFLYPDESMEDTIRESCGFLFDIVAGRVYPIHQTVKDYFLSEGELPTWLSKIDLADCHRKLAQVCMDFISLPFIANDPTFRNIESYLSLLPHEQLEYYDWCKDSFEFAEYGFSNWIVHFKQSMPDIQDQTSLLDPVALEYGEVLDLAVNTFCCSALPTHIEARVFCEAIPDTHPDRIEMLTALSESFVARYYKFSIFPDLLYGIRLGREVVENTNEDDPKLARRLSILADGLRHKFLRNNSDQDLTEAISLLQKAVQNSAVGRRDLACAWEMNAICLELHFRETFQKESLIQAISASKEAIRLEPTYFGNLITYANIISTRGELERDTDDLDDSTSILEKVLKVMPKNRAFESDTLHALGFNFRQRYHITKDAEDLARATEWFRQATLCPDSDDSISMSLRCLSDMLIYLYEVKKDGRLLTESIEAQAKSVELLDEDHPHRAKLLNRLDYLLSLRDYYNNQSESCGSKDM